MRIAVRCAYTSCGSEFVGNRDDGEVSEAEVRKMARKRGWLTILEVRGDSESVVTNHCPLHWPGDLPHPATGMVDLGHMDPPFTGSFL